MAGFSSVVKRILVNIIVVESGKRVYNGIIAPMKEGKVFTSIEKCPVCSQVSSVFQMTEEETESTKISTQESGGGDLAGGNGGGTQIHL